MKSVFNSLGSNYSRSAAVFRIKTWRADSRQKLESYLKHRYETSEAQVCYKGREALAFVLSNLKLPPNSSVVVNGYTCYAVYQAVKAAGLNPVYVDIASGELNFNADDLEQILRKIPNISGVIVQNTLGIPSDLPNIQKVCNKYGAKLVEDLAHSIGLKYDNGTDAGTVGAGAALSFSQDKVVDSVTGGAAIFNSVTPVKPAYQNAGLWHRFSTRLYPWNARFIRATTHNIIGKIWLRIIKTVKLLPGPMSGEADVMHKLPEWNCVAALEAFKSLEENVTHRQKIASIYRKNLLPDIQFRHFNNAIYLRFPIKVSEPFLLIKFLQNYGIYVGDRWYEAPVSPKRFVYQAEYTDGSCPNAERTASQMVNLPTHINVSEQQAKLIAGKVNQWLKSQ